jgi:DNA-binding transcriptional regulator YiaG
VTESSVWNWESNESRPFWRHWGQIREFLGYDPLPQPQTPGERLMVRRRLWGLSQKEVARRLGIDPTTLAGWERGKHRPIARHIEKLNRFWQDGEFT